MARPLYSHQSSSASYTLLADLPSPNAPGNFVGMQAFVATVAEGEYVSYVLAPPNEDAPAAEGMRWLPVAIEDGPYYSE